MSAKASKVSQSAEIPKTNKTKGAHLAILLSNPAGIADFFLAFTSSGVGFKDLQAKLFR